MDWIRAPRCAISLILSHSRQIGAITVNIVIYNLNNHLTPAFAASGRQIGLTRWALSPEERAQASFVEDGDAEFLGLGELRAGFFAGDDVVCVLADAA